MKKSVLLLLSFFFLLTGCSKSVCNSTKEDVEHYLNQKGIYHYNIVSKYDEFVGYATDNGYRRNWVIHVDEEGGFDFEVFEETTGGTFSECDGLADDYYMQRNERILYQKVPSHYLNDKWVVSNSEDFSITIYVQYSDCVDDYVSDAMTQIYDFFLDSEVDSSISELKVIVHSGSSYSTSDPVYIITRDEVLKTSKQEFVKKYYDDSLRKSGRELNCSNTTQKIPH